MSNLEYREMQILNFDIESDDAEVMIGVDFPPNLRSLIKLTFVTSPIVFTIMDQWLVKYFNTDLHSSSDFKVYDVNLFIELHSKYLDDLLIEKERYYNVDYLFTLAMKNLTDDVFDFLDKNFHREYTSSLMTRVRLSRLNKFLEAEKTLAFRENSQMIECCSSKWQDGEFIQIPNDESTGAPEKITQCWIDFEKYSNDEMERFWNQKYL